VIGANAAKLDGMDLERRVKRTVSDAERVFPGARQNFEGARSKSWSEDPWQRGGLCAFGPGQSNLFLLARVEKGELFSLVSIRRAGTAGCRVPLSLRIGLRRRFG
jgi:monoamine oxidase